MCEASETHDIGESASGALTGAEEASEDFQAPSGQDPAVIEVDPEFGLALGDWSHTGIEVIPLSGLSEEHNKDLLDKISIVTGIGNTSAQALQGVASVQGLVRLVPETVSKLQVFKPMTSGGLNLGALTDSGGKVAHLIRWTPAVGAQAVGLLAAMGPAAALFAIQLQLSSLSSRIDKNIKLTKKIIQNLEEEQYSRVRAFEKTTQECLESALEFHEVYPRSWDKIKTRESDLREVFDNFKKKLSECLSNIGECCRGGGEFLEKNAVDIERKAAALVASLGSWVRYQVLYVQVCRQDAFLSKDEKHLVRAIKTASKEICDFRSEALTLLEKLECAVHRCCLLGSGAEPWEGFVKWAQGFPGRRPGGSGKEKPEASKLRGIEQVRTLAEKLSELRESIQPRPEPHKPEVAVYRTDGDVARDIAVLRWVLPECYDQLRVLAEVKTGKNKKVESSLLGVTADSFFCVPRDEIRKKGKVARTVPLADIRYVRCKEEEEFDIIAKDGDFSISFEDWLQEDEKGKEARKIWRHLASFANLPDEERGEKLPISNVSQKSGRNELGQ
ncbi:hypothetical protein QTN80_12755 [Arachnia propionica]|uniref:hypothetical protein n=1 Tax=Arachnia propionica TaxID=1750 RepID=UPI00398FDF70